MIFAAKDHFEVIFILRHFLGEFYIFSMRNGY